MASKGHSNLIFSISKLDVCHCQTLSQFNLSKYIPQGHQRETEVVRP